jgi:amino acid permease
VDGHYHHLQYVYFVLVYLGLFSRRPLTVVSVNCLGIRVFGELEYWFASIKVVTLIGLIIFGIVVGQLMSFMSGWII